MFHPHTTFILIILEGRGGGGEGGRRSRRMATCVNTIAVTSQVLFLPPLDLLDT